jgi:hypothetical protein
LRGKKALGANTKTARNVRANNIKAEEEHDDDGDDDEDDDDDDDDDISILIKFMA